MTEPAFIHLAVHSEYAIKDGICRIDELIATAKTLQYPAIALTDLCNMFAQVKFYKAAIAAGIKPIFGADVWVQDDLDATKHSRMTLLAMNQKGHQELTYLISRSYTHGQQTDEPVIAREWLFDHHEGLIVLSGGKESEIGKALLAQHHDEAKRLTTQIQAVFGDRFYLSLTRTGQADTDRYTQLAVELAKATHCPVVAMNDVRFINKSDFDAHEARVCIHAGRILADPSRPKDYSAEQYLKSPTAMATLFEDIPQALQNAVMIAKRCSVHLKLNNVYLPNYQIPANETIESYLNTLSAKGLAYRFDRGDCHAPNMTRQDYEDRLKTEIDVINAMGFAGYFLIVADFIQWAKGEGIPVGPGRGSGAGSLVAYALQITDLDPLQYDLLFERFLNPERVSMPDFDIDFCMDKRDCVIDYVTRKYSREAVSQIITFGTMAAKAVVRDVGRVLGHPYGFVDRIAKLIPFELGITLDKALEEPSLKEAYEEDEEVKALIDLAQKLEGITRNAGKHAGGVVIAPGKLTDFTPLYCEPGSHHYVSQLDKDDVEAVGLVKFDFLGLRTLTIIDWACRTVNAHQPEAPIDITRIPLDCPKTFSLLKACQTTAVFQLESRGMKDLIKRLQPDCFEDIIALVALFRPGPLQSGMVDDFIDRKHGRQKVEYPHPDLAPILKPTYGVILYQEQVMQIAQVLAGFTLGGADLLRRAMGKKKAEEMALQRQIFVDGAVARGVNQNTATYIFDLMEKFAGYGFNKSHSAAYALVAYQTAWLKAHYPAAFMAAVLSADMDNTDKVVILIEECEQMNLKVMPPHINISAHHFVKQSEDSIFYGLGAIKGVGEAAIENIVQARSTQPFKDLFDLCKRVDLRKSNRRVMEALIKAGALDDLGPHRASVLATLDKACQLAEQQAKNQANGQKDMFFEAFSDETETFLSVDAWDDETRLRNEKDTLGLYLTGHPINQYKKELSHMVTSSIGSLRAQDKQTVTVAGLLLGIRLVKTKQGKRIAILTIDDSTARMDITLFSDPYQEFLPLLNKGALLVFKGIAGHDDYTGNVRLKCDTVLTFAQARQLFAKRLSIKISSETVQPSFAQELEVKLTPYREGTCPVVIDYQREDAKATIPLGPQWHINLDDQLVAGLRKWLGDEAIAVMYV